MDQKIFGYSWEQIQRAQRSGRLADPIDTSKPAIQPPSERDLQLLEKHGIEGLKELQLFGVLDRILNSKTN